MGLPTPTVRGGELLRDALTRELAWHKQALGHLAAIGDDRRALTLVAALELPLYALGWWRANTELQDLALGIPGPPSDLRAHVHAARGRPGRFHQFDEDHLQRAMGMADEVGDMATWVRAAYQLAIRRWWQGRHHDALELLSRGRLVADQIGDAFLIGECTRFTGIVLVCAGEAERGFDLQLGLLRAMEHTAGMELLLPHLRMHLGHCRRHVGDDDAARADLEAACAGLEEVGNRTSLIHVCAGLAEIHGDHQHTDDALALAGKGLAASAAADVDTYDPWILCTVARVHAGAGDQLLAQNAAADAVASLASAWLGETHRVASELAFVGNEVGAVNAAARLIGVVDATPDQRELPFQSPAERARLQRTRDAVSGALGDAYPELVEQGRHSSLAEAAFQLTDAQW
jgi:hypothetical protein